MHTATIDNGVPRPARRPVVYLGLWSAFALFAGAIVALEAVTIVRDGGAQKPLGWSYRLDQGQWIVQSVDPSGPAAGSLSPGEKIVAVDGDTNAARIGPRWYLRDSPDRTSYSLTVESNSGSTVREISWPTSHSSNERRWQWVHLATGIVYLLSSLLIAFGKPDSDIARRSVTSNMLALGFFLTVVVETNTGVLGHLPLALALGYYFVRPLHFMAGYRFTQSFPLGDKSTPAWRRFERIFYTAGFMLWIPSAYAAVLRSLGPQRATAIAASQYPFSLVHDALLNSLFFLFAGVAGVANGLVCWRNYKLVPAGDLQRRLRWVSVGIAAGLLPIVVVAPLLFVKGLSGSGERLALTLHVVNTAVVIIPICVGYAVLRHRVLGIRVVIRAGLRYLLARNVLRIALALPVVLILISVVSHPERTIGDLIIGPDGRANVVMLLLAGVALKYRTTVMKRIDRYFFREAYQRDQVFVALAEAISGVSDVPELARLLSSQIQAALHPTRVLALTRGPTSSLDLVYSSGSNAASPTLGDFGIPVGELRDVLGIVETGDIPNLSADGHASLMTLGITLAVPIRGPNEGLVGLILLGEKQSEEPYTRSDRQLLESSAAQTGIAWENLQLRHALSREQGVRRQLTARLGIAGAEITMECPECGTCYDSDTTRCTAEDRALVPSLPTTRILDGKYRLNRVIGRGGMGAVYDATDLRLNRNVAVKAMMGTIFDDAVARQRFAREARASAKVVHQNVVGVFDIGDFDGGAYIVLELLVGRNLRTEIDKPGGVDKELLEPLLANVFDGVSAAHAQHVVHRDLKPENIFLVENRASNTVTAKILDFGLAMARDTEFTSENKLTRTGTAVGTLAYMSPEQMVGEIVDERTDIHALGIIALEMLTGSIDLRGPFFTKAESILTERLAGTRQLPEARDVANVLRRAFNPDVENRYSSVEEFRSDLAAPLREWIMSAPASPPVN